MKERNNTNIPNLERIRKSGSTAVNFSAPKPQALKLPRIAMPNVNTAKGANMFYTNPVNSAIISNSVKPLITNRMVQSNYGKPDAAVKPVSHQPKSIEDFQNRIDAQKQAIADIDHRQYEMMRSGGDPDSLNALRESNVKALEALQINYGQAMGLGEKRPKNLAQQSNWSDGNAGQPADDIAVQSNEALFWQGFKKGLGLKPGEEIGQEGTGGGRPGDTGFAAQDTIAHTPETQQDYYAFAEGEEEDEEGGQFSSFEYGYSEDNPLWKESQLRGKINQYLKDLDTMESVVFFEKYPDRDILQTWGEELQELMGETDYNAFLEESTSATIGLSSEGSYTVEHINSEIEEAIIGKVISGTIETTGGYLAEMTGTDTLEFAFKGVPYIEMVFQCFGQYSASEDAKTALLENYVNFGANLWNKENGEEYREALVWSPMATFECDQEFMDRASLFQSYLSAYAEAGFPDATGMYWDEIIEEDRQVDEYNAQHPDDPKESKLDVIIWVASISGPAYNDLVQEAIVPLGKVAIESWVTIYFGDWGMNF